MRLLGPILYFRGQAGDGWRLSALLVREDRREPAPLETAGSAPIAPQCLAVHQGHALWRYDFSLPLRSDASVARYTIAGQGWSVHLPARHGPHRLAYTACSGLEDEDEGQGPPSRNALWRQLAAEHAERPFHLLLQGGDQLYADTIWDKVPELGSWRRLPWRQGNAAPFTPTMAEGAIGYYFDRYCSLWSQPELAPVLAAVPSVMMWDDHDIFDGWGSWPENRQECPVFQGLGAVAREHFALFQLASRPDRLPDGFGDPNGGHFGCSFRAGGIGIIAPDLRSERSRARIMGEAGWRSFTAALAGLTGCRQVLVMSSVPLTNAELPWLERIFVTIPGHSDLEDDLRDQWQSFGHRDEWRRMLACLADFSARTGARVTSLSGEIHLGALGLIEGNGVQVHELISSGIVHPPPPAAVVAAYKWLGRRDTMLEPDLWVRRLDIPGHGWRYLRARNWLSLDLAGDGRFEAVWHTERGASGRLIVPDA